MPLIRGRFEFDPETKVMTLWLSHRAGAISLGPEADVNKLMRGEVPIKLTGGEVVKKSKLTWSEQLKGKLEDEADALISATKVRRFNPRGKELGEKVRLSDDEFNSLLADLGA